MRNIKVKSAWIYNTFTDLTFIISPPFISLVIIYCFPSQFSQDSEITLYKWLFLIVFIDVAHVYSTLFRTYFDKDTYRLHNKTLLYIPLFSWFAGVMCYSVSPNIFWSCLAYLAVYHFVRQQYGFVRIYARQDSRSAIFRIVDNSIIYIATIYPILYWHLNPRSFSWFVPDDFLYFSVPSEINALLQGVYYALILTYFIIEIINIYQYKQFNIPKNLIIVGTLLSWYFGIIYFNGDMTFTFLNVVSHGIPYMALIWIYGRKKSTQTDNKKKAILFTNSGILLFILILIVLAYFEEGIWDAILWKERPETFNLFYIFPTLSDTILSLVIPLLALPQITHYVIDGYIWKLKKDTFSWKKNTLGL